MTQGTQGNEVVTAKRSKLGYKNQQNAWKQRQRRSFHRGGCWEMRHISNDRPWPSGKYR